MSKVAERKEILRSALIDAAEQRVAAHGVDSLRARDLASDVGCSLGAIYNVFEDLDHLILHVTLRTLRRIDAVMADAVDEAAACPEDLLVNLAWSYYDFAEANFDAWRGLFDHVLPKGFILPDWVFEGQIQLLSYIEKPLSDLLPNSSRLQINTLAQTMFSATHGVVELSLNDRTLGVEQNMVKPQLELLIRSFARGVKPEAKVGST